MKDTNNLTEINDNIEMKDTNNEIYPDKNDNIDIDNYDNDDNSTVRPEMDELNEISNLTNNISSVDVINEPMDIEKDDDTSTLNSKKSIRLTINKEKIEQVKNVVLNVHKKQATNSNTILQNQKDSINYISNIDKSNVASAMPKPYSEDDSSYKSSETLDNESDSDSDESSINSQTKQKTIELQKKTMTENINTLSTRKKPPLSKKEPKKYVGKEPRKFPNHKSRKQSKASDRYRMPAVPANFTFRINEAYNKRKDLLIAVTNEKIANFDKDYDVPEDTEIIDLTDDMIDKLITNRKNSVEDQAHREDWMSQSYNKSQLSSKNALRIIKNYYNRERSTANTNMKNYKKDMDKVDIQMSAYEEGSRQYKILNRQFNSIQGKWIIEVAKISNIDYELKHVPIFHPRDNIIGLKKIERKGKTIKYFVLVKSYGETSENKVVKKEISKEFIELHLDKDYLNYFEQFNAEDGWVCIKKGGSLTTIKNVIDTTNLEKAYTYDDPKSKNQKLISSLKLELQFARKKKEGIIATKMDWFYKIHGTDVYVETNIINLKLYTYDTLIDVYQKEAVETSVQEITNGTLNESYRSIFWDTNDPQVQQDLCNIKKIQTHFFNVKKNQFKVTIASKQISRLKYIHSTKKWIGVESENCKDSKHGIKTCVLTTSWVEANFSEETRTKMMAHSLRKKNIFLSVPIGDVIIINPTMDISKNPIIIYRNNENGICVFASLASTFYYLDYVEYSKIIIDLVKNPHPDFKKNEFNITVSLVVFILTTKALKKYRRLYEIMKLDKKENIFEIKMKYGEILILSLKQSDNHASHSICICNDFIFDSNTTNALPFTMEGLNCCCGENSTFNGFNNGYLCKEKSI
jgi:hypothetical protein